MDLTELAKYGGVGIILALIGVVVYVVREFVDVIKNHISKSANACEENTEVLKELSVLIRERVQ